MTFWLCSFRHFSTNFGIIWSWAAFVTEKETRFSFTSGFEAIPPDVQEASASAPSNPNTKKDTNPRRNSEWKACPEPSRRGRNSDRMGNSDTFIGIFSIRLL
jgi:hypothetical protein